MASFITLIAFILDWVLGDPQRWPHPVRWVGRLISWGESKIRLMSRDEPTALKQAGVLLALGVVAVVFLAVYLTLALAASIWSALWFVAATYLVYSALCLKDLYYQTWLVEKALRAGFLSEARQRLSWVVGRDTDQLTEAGVRRALIETLAENLSDGLVAPLFYLALGGPVLAWSYKAVNTLDSMIGYKNDRYLYLGRFAAKLDDAANFIPARLAALLLIGSARLLGHDWRKAREIWRRDGHLHSSPNSGQPEAAMAGALNVWLGGLSSYGGVLSNKPVINEQGREVTAEDVRFAENLMVGASILMVLTVLIFMLLVSGSWGWG